MVADARYVPTWVRPAGSRDLCTHFRSVDHDTLIVFLGMNLNDSIQALYGLYFDLCHFGILDKM